MLPVIGSTAVTCWSSPSKSFYQRLVILESLQRSVLKDSKLLRGVDTMAIYVHNKEDLNQILSCILATLKKVQPNSPKPQKFKEMYARAIGKRTYAALVSGMATEPAYIPDEQRCFTSNDYSYQAVIASKGESIWGQPIAEPLIDNLRIALNSKGCSFDDMLIRKCFVKGFEAYVASLKEDDDEALYNHYVTRAKEGL